MSEMKEKWGSEVARRGFAQIPNYVLQLNQFLDPDKKLTPVELLVLLQIVGAWWKKDTMPFPSMVTIAARCGVSDRQVQRAINNLVKRELLVRVARQQENGIRATNAYDLEPFVRFLAEVAKAFPNAFPRTLVAGKERRQGTELAQG